MKGEASLKESPCPALSLKEKKIKLFSVKSEITICQHHTLK